MPYANSNGVRINYQVEGAGQPLVLQHGFSGSFQGWYENGYVEALKDDYQLILIDARGHGASDKPHDPKDYEMPLRVADVVAVLDNLSISQAHYLGYSMGGRMGFGVARYAPERVYSLLIGGMHPYSLNYEMLDRRADDLKPGIEAYIATVEAEEGPLEPEVKARLLTNDAKALYASTIEYRDWPGIVDVLPNMTMPCLLFVGEEDFMCAGVKECVQHMPNVTLASLPGLDHTQCFLRGDLVLPRVKQFLAEMG